MLKVFTKLLSYEPNGLQYFQALLAVMMFNLLFLRARAHGFKLLQERIQICKEILLLLKRFLWEEITEMYHLVTGCGTPQELSENQRGPTAIDEITYMANPLKGWTHSHARREITLSR